MSYNQCATQFRDSRSTPPNPTYLPTDLCTGVQAWARLCGGGGVLTVVDQ